MELYAPNTYFNATKEELEKACNGCGAKGGIKVPDTFYGLDIKEACSIHDWMYKEGKTLADFLFANAMFLLNLVVIVLDGSNLIMRILRLSRAAKYFIAVAVKGQDAFWGDKPRNKSMNITYKGSFQ